MTQHDDTALCLYCGTERPRSEPTCPDCGNAWVDRRIASAPTQPAPKASTVAASTAAPIETGAAGADETAGTTSSPAVPAPAEAEPVSTSAETESAGTAPANIDDEPPPERPPAADPTLESFLSGASVATGRRVSPFLIGFGVALILFGVADLVWSRSGESDPVAAATTTTSTTAAVTTTAVPATTTTGATTTSSTTTTTMNSTTLPLIDPLGEPVALEDLTLGAVALGPLEVGRPASEILGRLAGGLGQPDAVDAITGEYGLCPENEGQLISWGALSVVTRDTANGQVFAGYRVDFQEDEPTAAIPTISGFRTGDSVADLRSVYSGLTVTFPSESLFVLESATAVLLWGPVTSSNDAGIVTGIYSRNACDGSAG